MNNIYKVGIYLRLSREDEQQGESGSIKNQRAILMNYIKEHQLSFIQEYVDDGVSGTTFDRVGFRQMIRDIEDKKINMVITKDTSRLGRDHIEFGYYVEKYFPEHQVRYVAVCDQIDTFYSNNDMLLFKSAYNDMYVKDISNKIRSSLNIKKKNGEFVGAYAPYGYEKDIHDKHRLVIDEVAAVVVKRIFQLFIEGNSITKIGQILTNDGIPIPSIHKGMNRGLKSSLFGIWTNRTITDILTNPTYMGDLTQGRSRKISYKSKKRIHTKSLDWIVKENSCPSIVTKDVFEMAQKIYQSNKYRYSNSKKHEELLFKGLIFCKECGHTIGFRRVNTKKGERIYGNCNYYLKHRYLDACTPHSISYLDLERILLHEIQNTYLDTNFMKDKFYEIMNLDFEKGMKKMEQRLKQIDQGIEFVYQKIDRLYEDKISDFIDEKQYIRMKEKLDKEISNKKQDREKQFERKEKLKQLEVNKILDDWLQSYQIDRLLLSTLIEKITISENGEIMIYYKVGKLV